MIIACPQCTTRYTVDPAAFRAPGRTVRCTTCGHTWFQAPQKVAAPRPGALALADGADETEAASGDIETETARLLAAARESAARFRRSMAQRRGDLREWAVLAAVVVTFFAVVLLARNPLVRMVPEAATIYSYIGIPVNIRGLEFRDVDYHFESENGIAVLAIEGKIANIKKTPQPVSKVRFALRDAERQELYHWTMKVNKGPLDPGETVPFAARLAAPPVDAYEVEVRFVTAREMGSTD